MAAPSGGPRPRSAAFLDQGERLFESYRAAEARLIGLIKAALDRTIAAQRRTSAEGAALALLGGLLVTCAVQRQRRRLYAAVVEPVADLATAVRRVRDGDLEGSVQPRGPYELQALADGFTEMTAALRADRQQLDDREAGLVEQRNRARRLLLLTRSLTGTLDSTEIVTLAVTGAISFTGATGAALWLLDRSGNVLTVAHRDGAGTLDGRDVLGVGVGVPGRAARLGQVVEERTPSGQGPGRLRLALPLLAGDRAVGVLELLCEGTGPLPSDLLDGMQVFTTAVVAALEVARLHSQTLELSQRDPLTGLLNRRRLDEDLPREVALAVRYDAPLAFLMLDLDHFKRLNDEHGHLVGDGVLRQLATELTGALRSTDLVYRYGGEEFSVLLRNTDVRAASLLAERVRRQIQSALGPQQVTVSVGVAAVPTNTCDSTELVRQADAALYAAKRAGRNRMAVARPVVTALPNAAS